MARSSRLRLQMDLKGIGQPSEGYLKAAANVVFQNMPALIRAHRGVLVHSDLRALIAESGVHAETSTVCSRLKQLIELTGADHGVYSTTLRDAVCAALKDQLIAGDVTVSSDRHFAAPNSPLYYQDQDTLHRYIRRRTEISPPRTLYSVWFTEHPRNV